MGLHGALSISAPELYPTSTMMSLTVYACLASLLPVSLQKAPVPAADTSAIEWVLPADFDAALERAKVENRLLLIKGVSFGIDEAGASCATAGTW